MRYFTLTLVALLALLMCVGVAEPQPQSQPPGKKKGPPGGDFKKGKGKRSLTVEEVAVHILAFDKDKVGKVTKEQLPERMQHLVEQGDTNKDGYLDKEEIIALAAKLEKGSRFTNFGKKGGFGKGGFGKGPKKSLEKN